MDLPREINLHNILTFLEYLYQNSISPKVIQNYLSSIRTMSIEYGMNPAPPSHFSVSKYIRSISTNSTFRPTPRGIFDLHTLYKISISCDIHQDPLLFRTIFLVAFHGFIRMSNVAPHSMKHFSRDRHILRQDVVFAPPSPPPPPPPPPPPGIHLLIKWTKTLQDSNACHTVQLPEIENPYLCPVRYVRLLLRSRNLSPDSPLFVNNFPPFNQVIDSHIRDALKKILTHLNISPHVHGFHTFHRSGPTLAFDNNISLQNIISHGLWRSLAVWTYLQNTSTAPSVIPTTFASLISSNF